MAYCTRKDQVDNSVHISVDPDHLAYTHTLADHLSNSELSDGLYSFQVTIRNKQDFVFLCSAENIVSISRPSICLFVLVDNAVYAWWKLMKVSSWLWMFDERVSIIHDLSQTIKKTMNIFC